MWILIKSYWKITNTSFIEDWKRMDDIKTYMAKVEVSHYRDETLWSLTYKEEIEVYDLRLEELRIDILYNRIMWNYILHE